MGVAQWADVPAIVLVGAVRFWLGCVATGVWERGGPAVPRICACPAAAPRPR